MDLIEYFDFTPNQRGGNAKQGERQLLLSYTRKDETKTGYWRVIIGTAVAQEILDFAGTNFNIRFGRNKFTNEWFMVVQKGIPTITYSDKEYERTQRFCYTCKPMYEALCNMLNLDPKKTKRVYYELSENCSNTSEVLTYKIYLKF